MKKFKLRKQSDIFEYMPYEHPALRDKNLGLRWYKYSTPEQRMDWLAAVGEYEQALSKDQTEQAQKIMERIKQLEIC